ncbi:MAG: sensor histidine kinase, partial [Verrucomicrobiota bacterium]
GAGGVGLAVRGMVRARYRRQIRALENEVMLDRERTRIARDLHDDLGATMTQAALALERATDPGSGPEARLDDVRAGLEATRRGMASLGAAVWAIRPGNQDVADLACYLADHAATFLRRAGIECEVDLAEAFPARRVSADARHQMVMMVREALNNVVRHSRARRVTFGIVIDDRGLGLTVTDDGEGMADGAAGEGGHGLRNLRERAEAIGAQCGVESRLGEGTRVFILWPWKAMG